MAWSYPTWQGVEAFKAPAPLRIGMFEIIRGIRQRAQALGVSVPQFYDASGNLTDITDADQLYGMRIGGEGEGFISDAPFAGNMSRINSAIEGFVENNYFSKETGESDAWTLAELEADIGVELHSPIVNGGSTQLMNAVNTNFWQGHQDALDRLIYTRARNYGDPQYGIYFRGTNSYNESPNQDPQDTLQEAWAERTKNAFEYNLPRISLPFFYATASWFLSSTFGGIYAVIVDESKKRFNASQMNPGATAPPFFPGTGTTMQGTITRANVFVSQSKTGQSDNQTTRTAYVNGHPVSFNTANDLPYPTTKVAISEASLERSFFVTVTMQSSPSSIPFNFIPIYPGGWSDGPVDCPGSVEISGQYVELFIDISSLLDDQA